jgi:hypothetical protein
MLLLMILVAGGFVFYIMTEEERGRLLRIVREALILLRPVGFFLFCAARTFVPALRAGHRLARAAAVLILVVAVAGLAQLASTPPTDVRPEIERLVAVEARIASIYDKATTQFKLGTLSADALAQVIERRIKPELQVVRIRVMSLENVGSEQQALLAKAKEYLHLRGESWRLRADALHRRNMAALRKVESTERASLAALDAAAAALPRGSEGS